MCAPGTCQYDSSVELLKWLKNPRASIAIAVGCYRRIVPTHCTTSTREHCEAHLTSSRFSATLCERLGK